MRAWLLVLVTLCLVRAHFPSGETTAAEGEQGAAAAATWERGAREEAVPATWPLSSSPHTGWPPSPHWPSSLADLLYTRTPPAVSPKPVFLPQSDDNSPAAVRLQRMGKRQFFESPARRERRRPARSVDTLHQTSNNSISKADRNDVAHSRESVEETLIIDQSLENSTSPQGLENPALSTSTREERNEAMTHSTLVNVEVRQKPQNDAIDKTTGNLTLHFDVSSEGKKSLAEDVDDHFPAIMADGTKLDASSLAGFDDITHRSVVDDIQESSTRNSLPDRVILQTEAWIDKDERNGMNVPLSELPIDTLPGVGHPVVHSLDDPLCPSSMSSCLEQRFCGFSYHYKCSCDEKCAVYRDCCEDFPAVCPEVYQKAMELLRNYSGLDIECLPNSDNKVISSCSASFRGGPSESLCKSAFQFGRSDLGPVTDKSTGLNFNNLHCALCNGADDTNVAPWENFLFIDSTFTGLESSDRIRDALEVAIEGGMGATFAWFPERAHKRNCFRGAIQSCPASSDVSLQRACNFSESFVKDPIKNIVYANRYCLLCMGLSTCDKVSPRDVPVERRHQGEFSVLMNWADAQDSERKTITLKAWSRYIGGTYRSRWEKMECTMEGTNITNCLIQSCNDDLKMVQSICVLPVKRFKIFFHLTPLPLEPAGDTSESDVIRGARRPCDVRAMTHSILSFYESHVRAVLADPALDLEVNVTSPPLDGGELGNFSFVLTFKSRLGNPELGRVWMALEGVPEGLLPALEKHGVNRNVSVCSRFGYTPLTCRGAMKHFSPAPKDCTVSGSTGTTGVPPWTSVILCLHLLVFTSLLA